MARGSATCARLSRRISAALVAVILSAALGASTEPRSTSPRLREGRPTAQIPQAFGGGEVVLELTVDSRGGVTRIERIRVTPPYADLVVNAAAQWRFEPATAVIEGRANTCCRVSSRGRGVPASLALRGSGACVPPQVLGAPSPRVPRVESIVMPAYPPTATGDGIVLVEIEMSGHAEPRGYRIVGPASGFDTAALDAVRVWRFGAPQAPDVPDRLFAYAVVGFRTPLAPGTRQRQ
jgi:outer membrane biosynthesis protein TonB